MKLTFLICKLLVAFALPPIGLRSGIARVGRLVYEAAEEGANNALSFWLEAGIWQGVCVTCHRRLRHSFRRLEYLVLNE